MMAFYTQNTPETDQRINSGMSRTAGGSGFDPGDGPDGYTFWYNQIGSFTGFWDPLQPASVNQARGRGPKAQRRPRRGNAIPPGLAAQQGSSPFTPNPYGVTTSNFDQFNQGEMWAKWEGRRYLGGYSDDYVSRTYATVPYGSDNVSMRYFAAGTPDGSRKVPVYGKPVYREGMEANFAARLTVDQIRDWQAFFQSNGFRTGPSGTWTSFEIAAMRNFMTMANGVPGGGMTVEVLRNRVEEDLKNGAIRPGELAVSLGGDLNEIGQMVQSGGTSGGGGGTGAEMIPYTETSTRTQIQEMSADQGLLVLRDAWMRSYGRAPTEGELSRFLKNINAAYRADPTVVTSVTTVDPAAGTTVTEETVDETAVDPQGAALRTSEEDNPERSEYQSNRYMSALAGLLGI